MKTKRGNIFKRFNQIAESNLIIILLVLVLTMWVLEDKFLSFNNITNLLRQTAIIGVMAVGMTFVIISGGIDLSVGSVLAFSSIMASQLMVAGFPVIIAIILAVLAGSMIGEIGRAHV